MSTHIPKAQGVQQGTFCRRLPSLNNPYDIIAAETMRRGGSLFRTSEIARAATTRDLLRTARAGLTRVLSRSVPKVIPCIDRGPFCIVYVAIDISVGNIGDIGLIPPS